MSLYDQFLKEKEVAKTPSLYDRFSAEKEQATLPLTKPPVEKKSLWETIKEKGRFVFDIKSPFRTSPFKPTQTISQLPAATVETLKNVFPGFGDETIKQIAEKDEVWTKLPFSKKVDFFKEDLKVGLKEMIKSYPRDAIQFIATPTIGAVEQLTGMSLGEVKLPGKIGEMIGPLTGTETQIDQYLKMGMSEMEAKALVVTQQMARALPFVTFFGAPAYVEALVRRPTIEQTVKITLEEGPLNVEAQSVSKIAKLPKPSADPNAIRSAMGRWNQVVRIKGQPNQYIVVATEPTTGLSMANGFEFTDPVLQLQASAFAKSQKLPEIPAPKGVNFLKVNPTLPGMNTWITTSPARSHVLMLEESLSRTLPTITTYEPLPLPEFPLALPAPKIKPGIITPKVITLPEAEPKAKISLYEKFEAEKGIKPKPEVIPERPEAIKEEVVEEKRVELPPLELKGLPDDKQALKNIQKLEVDLRKEYVGLGEKIRDPIAEIWGELEMAEAGERIPVKDEAGNIESWIGKKSSFPDWIPEELRSKKLFNKVMEGLVDLSSIKYPTGNRPAQRELYNVILGELDDRLGIDTSVIRSDILSNYESIKEKVEAPIREGIERREKAPTEEIKVEEILPKPKEGERQKLIDRINRISDLPPHAEDVKEMSIEQLREMVEKEEKGTVGYLELTGGEIAKKTQEKYVKAERMAAEKKHIKYPTKRRKIIVDRAGETAKHNWRVMRKKYGEEVPTKKEVKPKAKPKPELKKEVKPKVKKKAFELKAEVKIPEELQSLAKLAKSIDYPGGFREIVRAAVEAKKRTDQEKMIVREILYLDTMKLPKPTIENFWMVVHGRELSDLIEAEPIEADLGVENTFGIEEAEFREEIEDGGPGNLIVKKGEYVIDTDGILLEVTSGNEGPYGNSFDRDLNEGYIRAKRIGAPDTIIKVKGKEERETPDAIAYANQIRRLTDAELKKIGVTKKVEPPVIEKPEDLYRVTPKGEPTVADLVKKGDTIRSKDVDSEGKVSKGRLYIVEEVTGPYEEKDYPPHYSLKLSEPDAKRTKSGELPKNFRYANMNELVAVGGKIKQLFKSGKDEVIVIKKGPPIKKTEDLFAEKPKPAEAVDITEEVKEMLEEPEMVEISELPKEEQITFKKLGFDEKTTIDNQTRERVMKKSAVIKAGIVPEKWKKFIEFVRPSGQIKIVIPRETRMTKEEQDALLKEVRELGFKDIGIYPHKTKTTIIGRVPIEKVNEVSSADVEFQRLKIEQDMRLRAIKNDPASNLHRYADKVKGELPEVTGIGTNEFARRGGEIAERNGYPDSETAREAYKNWLRMDKTRHTNEELKEQARRNIGMIEDNRAEYFRKAEKMTQTPGVIRESKVRIQLQKNGYVMARQAKIESPEDVAVIFRELKNSSREKIFVVNLDKENKIINVENISIGVISASLLSSFEVLKSTILSRADSFYLVHNHPSGTTLPSPADRDIQFQVEQAAKLVGIKPKGHIIMDVTDFSFFRTKEGRRKFQVNTYPLKRVKRGIKVRVVEPKLFVKRNPILREFRVRDPADIAALSKPLLDKKAPTIIAIYMDPQLKAVGLNVIGFSFFPTPKIVKDIILNAVYNNSQEVALATNIELTESLKGTIYGIGIKMKDAGVEIRDVIQIKGEDFVSLAKQWSLRERIALSFTGKIVKDKAADYWVTTRPPTEQEKQIMELIKTGKEIPAESKQLLEDMIVRGWVMDKPKLQVVWKPELMRVPKARRQKESLSPEMRERIERINETAEERGINRNILSKLRNTFTGRKRTRLEDLDQKQLDELQKTLLELTPDQFGRIKLIDKETLEVMKDFIPPSLLKRPAVTTGDVLKYAKEEDMRYIINLLRAPRDVFKGSPILERIYHTVSTNEENMRADLRSFNKEVTAHYTKAKKENKDVDINVVRYIEQGVEAPGPETKALAEFLKKWWKDSLEIMKPRKIRKKYFTHTPQTFGEKVKENGLVQVLREVLMPLRREAGIAPEIVANLEYILGAEKFNPFALPRSEYDAYSKKIYKSVGAYAKVYYFKKHFDPIVKDVFRMRRFLPANKQLYLNKWLQNIRGRPLDFRWGRKAHRWANMAVRYEYARLLILNLGSGVVNAVGGTLNLFAEMPVKDFAAGHSRLITKQGRMILDKYGFTEQSFWLEPMEGFWDKLSRIERRLYIFMKMGEFYLRGIPSLALIPEDEFKTGKLSFKTRMEIRKLMGKTQGLYGRAQSPLASQTVVGRPLYQFKQWMILEMELFADWGKEFLDYRRRNKGLSGMSPVKNPGLGKMIKFLLLAIPLYLWGAEKVKKEMAAYWFLPLALWRTITHPNEVPVVNDLVLVLESFYDIIRGNEELAVERFRKEWLTHLPAGVELKRGKVFVDALKTGGYYSETGRLRKEMSPEEAFVQLFMGQMTAGAVEYRKMHEELGKLMPYTYIEYDEYFGQRVRKSEYILIKEKIISTIEEKGHKNISQVKKDKELVKMITAYNKQATERLKELMKKRNEALEEKFTTKEWLRNKKLVTIQPTDISRWMETKVRGESITSFERRLGR